jgi:1-deoxy-D-xylulose-5-phosphate synthase
MTRKGKGYEPAEKDPIKWHGPGPFDPVKGEIIKKKGGSPSYSSIFGDWLIDMAEADERVIGITPAMFTRMGMKCFWPP